MRTSEDDHRALPLLPFQTFRLFASRTFPSSDAGPATLPLYLASLKVSETFSVRIVPRKVFSPSHLGPSIQLPSRMTVDITFSCDILIITRVIVRVLGRLRWFCSFCMYFHTVAHPPRAIADLTLPRPAAPVHRLSHRVSPPRRGDTWGIPR